MALVLSRNVKDIVLKSCTNFLSKIVVQKFDNESKEVFRRLEKFTKCFIRTHLNNNLLKKICVSYLDRTQTASDLTFSRIVLNML